MGQRVVGLGLDFQPQMAEENGKLPSIFCFLGNGIKRGFHSQIGEEEASFQCEALLKLPSGGGSSNGAIGEAESHEKSILINSEAKEAAIMDAKIDDGNSEFGTLLKLPSGGGSSNGAIGEAESHEKSILINSEAKEAAIMDAKIDDGNSEFGSKDGAFIWHSNRWSSCN
ncbi:unnamed protein product [Ilex paraguariensis]|uniref:Uncharacterized protein n=1 Tax=Ilex paraguariensis TaxID=185542 RepID=A0ABC8SHU0_9AQUA